MWVPVMDEVQLMKKEIIREYSDHFFPCGHFGLLQLGLCFSFTPNPNPYPYSYSFWSLQPGLQGFVSLKCAPKLFHPSDTPFVSQTGVHPLFFDISN